MQNDVAIRESYGVVNFEESAMNVESVTRQVAIIQNVMKSVMKQDEHYGTIPGTNKPSLLKPGAEKLNLVFRLRPEYQITKTELYSGHREYEVVCTLYHIPTGQSVGQGVGSATTMEGKYRFRGGEKKDTGKPVPKDYWNLKKTDPAKAKELIGGDGFGTAKFDGEWRICELGEKIEHDNPADYYNTVLKMAKKRAHVDAILTATAASDIFTQDTEDMTEVIPGAAEVKKESKPPLQEPQKKSGNGEQKQGPAAAETVTVYVKNIFQKPGEKNGKKYVKYTVVDGADNSYGTFSDTIAGEAKKAKESGAKVKIGYNNGQFGKDIVTLEINVPEEGQ